MATNGQRERVDLDEELALLLKEQEAFMRQSKAPAAKVMRRSGGAPAVASSSGKAAAVKEEEEEKQEEPAVALIVGKVVERDVVRLDLANARVAPPVRREATGFPSVRRRGESLFGKRQKQSTATARPAKAQPAVTNSAKSGDPMDQERRDIDAANTARLNEMSPEEIREAQQELLRSLDPALVEKLRNRSRPSAKRDGTASTSGISARPLGKPVVAGASVVEASPDEEKHAEVATSETASAEAGAPEIDLSKITTEEQLQASAQLLPPEERAKHEWMQSVPKSQQQAKSPATSKRAMQQSTEPATLERFDFDGHELPSETSDVPVHSGLFHHGDEPEAPGYTMPELLHLARSSVASQRAMALTVIAKVLTNRQTQERDHPASVAPKVLPRELPVTLRISLDDQNYTALGAGVSALHAFLVPVAWSSESALTSNQFELAFGTVLPPPSVHLHENFSGDGEVKGHDYQLSWQQGEVIYIDDAPDEDGTAISDEDIAAMDPVQALLHMDIGTRFRFILDTIQLPDQDASEKILDILVAIARHSPKGAREIATNARLLKVLQQKFIENEDVLTLQDADDEGVESDKRALRLTLKALVLVRSLCQGERAAASVLMSSGVIQTTKGFLALKGAACGEERNELFGQIQIESLRIWRVLLGYALDFHCFAYLFPLLSGFTGVDLVGKSTKSSEEGTSDPGSLAPAAVPALFASLEAFSGLASMHEAQHYFNQLSFFIDMAADRLAEIVASVSKATGTVLSNQQVVTASTALRFLSAASKLATKFHLETRGFTRAVRSVDALVDSPLVTDSLAQISEGRDLLLAIAIFHRNTIQADLLGDDLDEEEASLSFFKRFNARLSLAAAAAATTPGPLATIQACALVVTLADMATRTESANGSGAFVDASFMAELYVQGLALVEKLSGGLEYWISQLFTKLLFHRGVLRSLSLFCDEVDAKSLSNVLVPIYLALVNSTREQEEHSARHFTAYLAVDSAGASANLPRDKKSCNLRMPQYEQEYVSNNLPLPSYWMYCPFSLMESATGDSNSNISTKNSADPTPSRAQSDEMKLIVSAACRFLYQFETQWRHQRAASSSTATLNDEDKLFHLLHVFFAGSDVLFDEHVDAALDRLLAAFVAPVMADRTNQPQRLYDGMMRNLKRFQHLEGADDAASSSAGNSAATTFTSDEQLVMTFAEKLVAEFASTSYANAHFARSVTLFLTADFPLAIRKWVWKELYDSRLLHALAPFSCANDKGAAMFWRCALGAKRSDEQLLQLMKAAVCQGHVSPERGLFAYALAIQYIAVYLFASASAMSAARRQMVHELLSASANVMPRVWRHLLSCALEDAHATPSHQFLSLGEVASERVDRIRAQAALNDVQREQFDKMAAQARAETQNGK